MSTQERELAAKSRRQRPVMLLALCAAALAVLAFSAVGVGLLISAWRVREELDKICSEGEPVTAADLESLYSLPPGSRDATALWLVAIDVVSQDEYKADSADLPLLGDVNMGIPEPSVPWPKQAAADQFLARYSTLLANLREAASTGAAARYPTHFAYNDSASLKPLQGLRAICRLLKFEWAVHVRRGDGHAAAVAIDTLLALAKSLDGEPTLVALLSRISKDGVAFDCLQRLMATDDLSDGDLAAIASRLSAIDYYPHLHQAVLGARVTSMKTFDNPEVLDDAAPAKAASIFFGLADRAVYLQHMRDVVAASAATDQLSLQTAMDDARERIRETFKSPSASWKYPIAKLSLSALDPFVVAIGRGTARRDVAHAAIAVERFRRTKDQLPHSLGDLVPEFLPQAPDDPFDGAPLRWIVSDDEYRIYSIGPDGIDQGGTADESPPARDIVFRVPLRKEIMQESSNN